MVRDEEKVEEEPEDIGRSSYWQETQNSGGMQWPPS